MNGSFRGADLLGRRATTAQYNKGDFLSHDQYTFWVTIVQYPVFEYGFMNSVLNKTPLGAITQRRHND
jgi:hypothetical protein